MKKKERESSFELMRILSMFFVVLYHFLISTGGSILNNSSGNVLVFWEWISMIIIVHVNSFILSTGYFQYKQKFSWKKFFSLLIMGYMYKVIISIILQLVYHTPLSSVEILRTFSPFYFNNYWFLSVYLLLYLLSPYINILINKLSQKEHRNFIILLFIIFTIIPTITNQKTFSNTGFGIIHFIYLYIIGSYLAKYPISLKNYSEKKLAIGFLFLFLFMGTVNFLLYEFFHHTLEIQGEGILFHTTTAVNRNLFYYQNPLLIVQSISYFLIFSMFHFKSKIINHISCNIFAVYLITEHNQIIGFLYDKWLVNGIHSLALLPVWKIFVYALMVMIISIIIEELRKIIIKIFVFLSKIFIKICKN